MTNYNDLKKKLDGIRIGDRVPSYVSARAIWEVVNDAESGIDIVQKFGLVAGKTGVELSLERLCKFVYVPKSFVEEETGGGLIKPFTILGEDELIIFSHTAESNPYPYELVQEVVHSRTPQERISSLINSKDYRVDVREYAKRLVQSARQVNPSRRNRELELAMIALGEMYETEMVEEE